MVETGVIWECKFGFKGYIRWQQQQIQKERSKNSNKQQDKGMAIGKQRGSTS